MRRGALGEGVDEKWKDVVKLSVYRGEKKNEDGELVQAAGWKGIGKGQLRILCQDAVHFIEFRPTVSEGSTNDNDPEDSMVATKTRYGKPVVSATLRAETDFTVSKKSVVTSLWTQDAAGKATYAKYHIPLQSEARVRAWPCG